MAWKITLHICRPAALVLLGSACAGAFASTTAQAPSPPRGTEAPPPAEAPARVQSAEHWFRRGTWLLGAQVGGAAFTDFQRATARRMTGELTGQRFQRRVSAGTTGSAGVSVAYWVTDTWGIRTAFAYAPSTFSVWTQEDGRVAAAGEDGAEYARLGVMLMDAAVVFRFPRAFGRVVPYGMAGGGLVRYRSSGSGELPPEARERFADGIQTAPAALIGLGAAIPLQRRSLLLTFELTGHIAPTPLDDAGAGNSFEVGGVPLRLEPLADQGGTDGVGVASTLRLMVGVSLPLR